MGVWEAGVGVGVEVSVWELFARIKLFVVELPDFDLFRIARLRLFPDSPIAI